MVNGKKMFTQNEWSHWLVNHTPFGETRLVTQPPPLPMWLFLSTLSHTAKLLKQSYKIRELLWKCAAHNLQQTLNPIFHIVFISINLFSDWNEIAIVGLCNHYYQSSGKTHVKRALFQKVVKTLFQKKTKLWVSYCGKLTCSLPGFLQLCFPLTPNTPFLSPFISKQI